MKSNNINKNLLIVCITIAVVLLFGIFYKENSSVQIKNKTVSLASEAESVSGTVSKRSGSKTKSDNSKSSSDSLSIEQNANTSEGLIYEDYNIYKSYSDTDGFVSHGEVSKSDNVTSDTVMSVLSESYTEEYRLQIEKLIQNICTTTHITITVSNYSEAIYDMLNEIKSDMLRLDSSFFDGMNNKGYKCSIRIVSEIPNGGFARFSHNGKTLEIEILSGVSNWNIYFSLEFASACEYMLSMQTDIEVLYDSYSKLNPDDFVYGEYAPQYIERTTDTGAFVNIRSEQSVYDDRTNLFAMYLCGWIQHGNLYLNGCLFNKLECILNDLNTYIG